MKTAHIQSGEKVTVTEETRDIGHGLQVKVIYSDNSEGWEHVEDLELTTLAEKLRSEIESYDKDEPNAQMFVDRSSIFWVSKEGHYVWMNEHQGIDDYIDEKHVLEYEQSRAEGVNNEGVFWMNSDFESPYHILDFLKRIDTVNV